MNIKTRAKHHDLMLRKDRRSGGYYLVDVSGNYLAAPGPMTLKEVELWLDDLDNQAYSYQCKGENDSEK